ncbi:cubilin-like [Pomacea canaliculata]|uniref:cubilin-like n=1 Tax=Pomacea canaliculata TaxID=400727 RepID=UPI000D73C193|nr:cubilin-like [Pomacea canaliculata]
MALTLLSVFTLVILFSLISPATSYDYGPSLCSLNGTILSARPGITDYLTSPNFPMLYYRNEDCQLLISAPSGYIVQMEIWTLTLDRCCDYLELFDGISMSNRTLAKIYTKPWPDTFYTFGQHMYIRFFSDDKSTNNGFRLRYEALTSSICPRAADPIYLRAVAGQLGYLTSPNYPSNYENNTNCMRRITATMQYVVKVTILNMNMDPCRDVIQIFDGMSASSPLLAKLYSMPSQVFYSSDSYMYIRFFSGWSSSGSGFRLTYESVHRQSVPPTVPIPIFTSTTEPTQGLAVTTTTAKTSDSTTSGTPLTTSVCSVSPSILAAEAWIVRYITTPNYPLNYDNNARCQRRISAPSGYFIKLTALHFDLESLDYLEVFDGRILKLSHDCLVNWLSTVLYFLLLLMISDYISPVVLYYFTSCTIFHDSGDASHPLHIFSQFGPRHLE